MARQGGGDQAALPGGPWGGIVTVRLEPIPVKAAT